MLGPNQKIYGIPTNATSVLELDPATRKVTTFGDFGTALAPAKLLWRLALRARQVDWRRAGSDGQDHWHPMCAQTSAPMITSPHYRRTAWQMRRRAFWRSTQRDTR